MQDIALLGKPVYTFCKRNNYAGFPGWKQHEDFIAEVEQQARLFESEDSPNPGEFVKYLMDWILHHVAGMDKKYVPYLASLERTG